MVVTRRIRGVQKSKRLEYFSSLVISLEYHSEVYFCQVNTFHDCRSLLNQGVAGSGVKSMRIKHYSLQCWYFVFVFPLVSVKIFIYNRAATVFSKPTFGSTYLQKKFKCLRRNKTKNLKILSSFRSRIFLCFRFFT